MASKWKTVHKRVCVVCGKEFKTTHPKQICCNSQRCSKIRHKKLQEQWRSKQNLRAKIKFLLDAYKEAGYKTVSLKEFSEALAKEMNGKLTSKYGNMLLEEITGMGYKIRIGGW